VEAVEDIDKVAEAKPARPMTEPTGMTIHRLLLLQHEASVPQQNFGLAVLPPKLSWHGIRSTTLSLDPRSASSVS